MKSFCLNLLAEISLKTCKTNKCVEFVMLAIDFCGIEVFGLKVKKTSELFTRKMHIRTVFFSKALTFIEIKNAI